MKAPTGPFRFLIVVVGGWIAARVAFFLAAPGAFSGETAATVAGLVAMPLPMKPAKRAPLPAPAATIMVELDAPAPAPRPGLPIPLEDSPAAEPRRETPAAFRLASSDLAPSPPPSAPPAAIAEPGFSRLPSAPSRWSGSGWLFVRPDHGRSGLAAGGQLGGSQAGARLTYRLADRGVGSLALAGRVSTPLREQRGAEAAVGVDWRPLARIPFRLSVERRVAIGREGRDAWSAYAAGGFYKDHLPGGLEMDGYGQAGVVGARARDLFADGAVRVDRAVPLPGGKRLVVGGGLWGAAQPGVSRFDLGLRAALSMPVAGATVTAAVDWRIRVAGDAAPESGAAFTLAADF